MLTQDLCLWEAVYLVVAPHPSSWTTFAAQVVRDLFWSAAITGSKCLTVIGARLLECFVTVSDAIQSVYKVHIIYFLFCGIRQVH